MMKRIIYVALLITSTVFSGCSDDKKTSSPSGSSTTNVDFKGTYSTNYTYIETSKSTGAKDTTTYTGITLEITGESPTFTITDADDSNNTLVINTSGSNFTGGAGTGVFSGASFSGNLNGNLLTINETGEDATSTWTGQFLGNKQSTGGGGGGGGTGSNTLSVDGETVGAFWTAKCQVDYTASFAADGDNEWHITIYTLEDCDHANNGAGNYTIKENWNGNIDNGECAIYISKQDDNGYDLLNLDSRDNTGTMTVSFVNGKKRVSVSNLTMQESVNGGTKQVSFSITEQ